jgi:hypothetical protein
MKFRILLLWVWLPGVLMAGGPASGLLLKNPLASDRLNEPVVVTRAYYEKTFGAGEVPVLKYPDGRMIPIQCDDLNGDGSWDELAFVVNIKANSMLKLSVSWATRDKAMVFEKKTQTWLAKQNTDGTFTEVREAGAPVGLAGFPAQYQSEGVGWENDKMAFRVYFDCRNVKDLFGKLKPGLILHKAGTPELGNYHSLSDWGMDILHCGSSLGAGGLALLEGDSLYRLGSTPVYRYKKITEGPVRTIFELTYRGWEVAGSTYEATERITLWIGSYGFKSEVTVSAFTGQKELVTGIVTTKLVAEPIRFQASPGYTAILTHGVQSLNNDVLAMAVMAPSTEVTRVARTSKVDFYKLGYQTVPEKSFSQVISDTYYLSQRIANNTPSIHYFYAFWGLEDARWKKVEGVRQYLEGEAERMGTPLMLVNSE